MAILKHFASKSSNYGASLDYVLFDHDEKSGKVLRDANGNRILRRQNGKLKLAFPSCRSTLI